MLLQTLRNQDGTTPFEMQVSTPNSKRYDLDSKTALVSLRTISKNSLTLHENTLFEEDNQKMFQGSFFLLLYDNQKYSTKFSSVALYVFYASSTIITTSDALVSQKILQFQTGLILQNKNTIKNLILLIKKIERLLLL